MSEWQFIIQSIYSNQWPLAGKGDRDKRRSGSASGHEQGEVLLSLVGDTREQSKGTHTVGKMRRLREADDYVSNSLTRGQTEGQRL